MDDGQGHSLPAIVAAQYRWLAINHEGFRFKAHMRPNSSYLTKLGCEAERGSLLTIETSDGAEVTTCFCWAAGGLNQDRAHSRELDP